MSRSAAPSGAMSQSLDVWPGAPFDPPLAEEVRRLLARLDGPQRLWLSGYLAGSLSVAIAGPSTPQQPARPAVTILFGSQSGNAQRLAKEAAEALARRGVPSVVLDMIDCRKADLVASKTLLVIVSTQGDGDPPDRAVPLWELLKSRKAPELSHASFAVLGLGDSSYEKFCETGRQFDARLAQLGARRLRDRVDCDVDFDGPARTWTEELIGTLDAPGGAAGIEMPHVGAPATERPLGSVSKAYTRKNPFIAEVLVNQRLTAAGSSKDVRHIELSLAGSDIRYEPGDAIGVVPRNAPETVDELLSALPFGPESAVDLEPESVSLRAGLSERFDIGPINHGFLERYGKATDAPALLDLLSSADEARVSEFVRHRDLLDLVREFPPDNLDATAFARLLRPLAPRLYSIASSLHASADEAHLAVSIAEHEARGARRRGVVSGMLASLTGDAATAPIYLHRNSGFRLPAPDAPIIMIGPGTGVAPFRAFVAERAALGAKGRNWLFFGDRSFETDFLYQSEWLAWRKQGVLTRLEVAFSRDQQSKIYVQHRLRACGEELWAWLASGAHVYVCGDASRMAGDVHAALLEIVQRHAGLSEEQAIGYLAQLQRDRRYQRDVY